MDDDLETPSSRTAEDEQLPSQPAGGAEDEQSSDDEDGGPDWTKLPAALATSALARPVIPKRGEKDHEPAAGGETRLQSHVLDRARGAMFDALRAERGSSSKSISRAVWHPSLARAHVTAARGVHFASMGHSVARAASSSDRSPTREVHERAPKRLELLPEEALYLIERGALFCAKAYPDLGNPLRTSQAKEGEDVDEAAPPMSVQQAYAEMIGAEGLTLEKYQVYAYLRRLGYIVTRTRPPTPAYPTPPPLPPRPRLTSTPDLTAKRSLLSMISAVIALPFRTLGRAVGVVFTVLGAGLGLSGRVDWWRPIHLHGRSSTVTDYASLFSALRRIPIPPGNSPTTAPDRVASRPVTSRKEEESPYTLFYNLYKPSTPFRKSAPGTPDFQLVVVDARTTPMPTLAELSALFNVLPETPPPVPRRRVAFTGAPSASASKPSTPSATPTTKPADGPSITDATSTSALDTTTDAPPLPPTSTANTAPAPAKRRVSFKLDVDTAAAHERPMRAHVKTPAPSAAALAAAVDKDGGEGDGEEGEERRGFFARLFGISRSLPASPPSGVAGAASDAARLPTPATATTTPPSSAAAQGEGAVHRPPPRANPFPALKQGKVVAIIAVVDAGSVGFFRFGQGVFEEWPMA